MESSLGVDNGHDEASYGQFGIRAKVTINVRKFTWTRELDRRIEIRLQRDFEFAARSCLLIYRDNIRYIKQWHRNRGLTITGRRAWQLAAQVYPGGTSWPRREEYGRVFRNRVRFLVFMARQRELLKRLERR